MKTTKTKLIELKFIDVGDPTPEGKRRNESIARSHVMTAYRKAQREEREKKRRGQREMSGTARGEKEAVRLSARSKSLVKVGTSSMLDYSQPLDDLLQRFEPRFPGIVWSLCLRHKMSSVTLSRSGFVEADLNVLKPYSGQVSPHLHQLIDHGKPPIEYVCHIVININLVIHYAWAKFWPGRVAGEASPLAKEWWPLFSNIPAVFHAFLFPAAVHYDNLHITTSFSQTPEISRTNMRLWVSCVRLWQSWMVQFPEML